VGINGNIDKPVLGTVPEGWNGFADTNTGSTYAGHFHVGAAFGRTLSIGAHAIHTFASDDQASVQDQPDGSMSIFGGEVRVTPQPFGHLHLSASLADAQNVRSLGNVVQYLNTKDGPDLIRNYLGAESNGTGSITTLALQYDLSVAQAILYPRTFSGNAPDVRLSLFGMMFSTKQDDQNGQDVVVARDGVENRVDICSVGCYKAGAEVAYSPLSWFAVSLRGDHVRQDTSGTDDGVPDTDQAYNAVSPRLIFRSDWNSQDQVVLQYSEYMYGGGIQVRNPDYDPRDLFYTPPDKRMISLTGTMWW
jgi:hypothetical protein